MEYKAFKYYEEEMETTPVDFSNVYYDPTINTFATHACSLIAENDDKYHFIGPDKKLIRFIDKYMKKYKNRLPWRFTVKTNGLVGRSHKLVPFSDPKFAFAFDDYVAMASTDDDYFYTGSKMANQEYVKVNSMEDVERLDREYQKRLEIERAEWERGEAKNRFST